MKTYRHRDGWGNPDYAHAVWNGEPGYMLHKDGVTKTPFYGTWDQETVDHFVKVGLWIEIPPEKPKAELEPYQERMVDEQVDLELRIRNLEVFLKTDKFKGLDVEEQGLMMAQYTGMVMYETALFQRIERF